MNKTILGIVVVVVAVLIFLSIFLFMHKTTQQNISTTITTTTTSTTTTASNGQLLVKVLSAENRTTFIQGNGNYIYFKVNITDLQGEFNVSPTIFYLSTNQGLYQAFMADEVPFINNYLNSVTLTPGTFTEGALLFQIPAGAQVKALEILKNGQPIVTIPITSLVQVSSMYVTSETKYITVNFGNYPSIVNNTIGVVKVPFTINNTLPYCPINITEISMSGANGYVTLLNSTKTLQPDQFIEGVMFIYPPNVSKSFTINLNVNFTFPHSLQNYFSVKILSINNITTNKRTLYFDLGVPIYSVVFNITWYGKNPLTINPSNLVFVTSTGNVTPSYGFYVGNYPIPSALSNVYSYKIKPGETVTFTALVPTNGSIDGIVYTVSKIMNINVLGFSTTTNNVVIHGYSCIVELAYVWNNINGLPGFPAYLPVQNPNIENGVETYVITFPLKNLENSPIIIKNITVTLVNSTGNLFAPPPNYKFNYTLNSTFPIVLQPSQQYYVSLYITLPNSTYSYDIELSVTVYYLTEQNQ